MDETTTFRLTREGTIDLISLLARSLTDYGSRLTVSIDDGDTIAFGQEHDTFNRVFGRIVD